MPNMTMILGDFFATAEPNRLDDSALAEWAAQWNSGVDIVISNPFHIEYTAAISTERGGVTRPEA